MWDTVWVVFFLSSNKKKTFLTKEKRPLRAGLQKTVSRMKAALRQHCMFAQALTGLCYRTQVNTHAKPKFGFPQLAINFMATPTSLNHCLQHVSSAELQTLRMM